MALPVSKQAPELAFLLPLGDLFVILQPSYDQGLKRDGVKVVREVGINSDVWLLIIVRLRWQ